ncbi:bifunctional diguanylate cyclase/phosphodiesterase [Hyphomicrobium sp.]|uniref:bifunctional diguanylate cyclase/phosphodiesterase n=1 Tax=Hyphomicrobium sp. TaxID=82 RepID=UPI002D7A134B|nr:bifunctional diguanylate cyclase/phosphodiesterase [Hyphomicrobium sp.]HET6389650.1 bifunctional diguanylate cyclase/phosphodiesterase [Hyphomicrobium sp.]
MISGRDAGTRPESTEPEDEPQSASERQDLSNETDALDLVSILSSVEETAYVWDLKSGRVDWESNAPDILGVTDLSKIATGAAYHALIAPEHLNVRQEVFSRTAGADNLRGVPYHIHYRLRPRGLRSAKEVHLEDQGRWWPGPDGHPQLARGVVRIVDEQYLEQQRLLARNDLDELTGQLNRIRLMQALRAVLARTERDGRSCAFLMISVNNLAVINETFGLQAGDEVIAEIGRRIKSKLRGGDVIGRYSDNKFGLILMNCGPAAAHTAAERFIGAVRDTTIKTTAAQLAAAISLGGVIVPDQAKSVQDTVNFALHALDLAKSKRHDSFALYQPSSAGDGTRHRNKTIAESVVSALDENRMRLVLQPLVATSTGKADIYEALLRMERPDGSLVPAGEFVPVAEQLGLSRLIDRRALELAVELLKKHPELHLSVNVSGHTCTDKEWLAALRRLTEGDANLLHRMIIEITETVALQEINQTANFVDTLKELGCRVAIDDFGAGYTSFKNLKSLNVDMVKIDGAFVKNVVDDKNDQIFIKTMLELANSFGMETVAEWVGDERSANYLIDAGVTYLQGYYYGMPIDSSEYVKRA